MTPQETDISSALQFNVLTAALGLRAHHQLLDIGCGSLRGGRLFIIYLAPGHYFGIDPDEAAIEDAIVEELGEELLNLKQPRFDYNSDFDLGVFGQKFDFLLAKSIFTHAGPSQIRKCMAEAREVLLPTGFFVATYFEGFNEWRDEKFNNGDMWQGGARFYTKEHMIEFIEDAGLVFQEIDVNPFRVACPEDFREYQQPGMFRQDWFVAVHPSNRQHLQEILDP